MSIALPSPPLFSTESTVTPDYGMAVDQTDDGASKLRDLYATQQYTITLIWPALLAADRTTIEQFLLTNRAAQILITIGGHTYTTQLIGAPPIAWQSGVHYKLSATFRGTRG